MNSQTDPATARFGADVAGRPTDQDVPDGNDPDRTASTKRLAHSAPAVNVPSRRPDRGMSLGWRLSLATTLIVVGVMGAVSAIQQRREIRQERSAREELLATSLVPLQAELGSATNLGTAREMIEAFHSAYLRAGNPDHHLLLKNAEGELLVATDPPPAEGRDGHPFLGASLTVEPSRFLARGGLLEVREDATSFQQQIARRWRAWLLHMVVTILTVLISLHIAIRYLVSRPINRLLASIRRMEMGYWDAPTPTGGAWEMEWLGWRFQNLGAELQKTIAALVAAERRAVAREETPRGEAALRGSTNQASVSTPSSASSPLRARLANLVVQLETMAPETAGAKDLAHRAWNLDSIEAERHGEMTLKTTIEDASLRILEPDVFTSISGRRESTITFVNESGWVHGQVARLTAALDDERIPVVSIQHRIKHTAGVWRKMTTKNLTFEQIQDLVAFRVVVPTEADCYRALGAIHRAFQPVVVRFKDYVATPKTNGYQSIHTTLAAEDGPRFEIQIRSVAMHSQAETGSGAHWAYSATRRPAPVRRSSTGPSAWLRWLGLGSLFDAAETSEPGVVARIDETEASGRRAED